LLVRTIVGLGSYGAFQLRLLSVICGIATLALVYPLAVKIFNDRRLALLSLIIFALNEPLIWHAQIARPYSLALDQQADCGRYNTCLYLGPSLQIHRL
jgi:4-amino-4-deoxy-L-arabinose transferase-like glycosyltransferase